MQYVPLWTTILRSPKVFGLDDSSFRFWVNCLALAQDHDQRRGTLPDLESIAFTLHLATPVAEMLMSGLVAKGFIEDVGETYVIHNWSKWRSKPDPTSTERKRRERERKKANVTDVTRDIVSHDIAVTGQKPTEAPKGASGEVKHAVRMENPSDSPIKTQTVENVTDVTRDMKSHECHAIQNSTEQNYNSPLPPVTGGERDRLEPFQSQPPVSNGGMSPEAVGVMETCGRRWGSQGADVACDLLATHMPSVVAYGATATYDSTKFDRKLTPGATAYWRRVCQNHRDGPPAEGAPRAVRAAPTPIKYTVCTNPDDLIPPALRGKKHVRESDPDRNGRGEYAGRPASAPES